GTWSSGHRAKRIRQLLEAGDGFSSADFITMQYDVRLLRAEEARPGLLAALGTATDPQTVRATEILSKWDCQMTADSVGAALFELFFRHWTQTVAAARFPADLAPLMADVVGGLALALLDADQAGWFAPGRRIPQVLGAFNRALAELAARLGPDPAQWQWGRLHTITLNHPLSARGDLAQLLDRGGYPLGGNGFTVCNTGGDAGYAATLGANYRIVVDLSAETPQLLTVASAGQSGQPGSVHYGDQLPAWLAGRYHHLVLDRQQLVESSKLVFG
ncbi:MAG TPA: penicillin acylase family protein, partial [Caldilineaceae bacterium]|nr:penicillin acylase family protein [Caldilineaceae bacterium]